MFRARAVNPFAQRALVVETDVGRTQAAIGFGDIFPQGALPLTVRRNGLVKIHWQLKLERPFRYRQGGEKDEQDSCPAARGDLGIGFRI